MKLWFLAMAGAVVLGCGDGTEIMSSATGAAGGGIGGEGGEPLGGGGASDGGGGGAAGTGGAGGSEQGGGGTGGMEPQCAQDGAGCLVDTDECCNELSVCCPLAGKNFGVCMTECPE